MLAEIDAVCGDRSVEMADIGRLDWCRAVIQETLRLYPPVPLLPRQAREADRIADVEVEKGALIMIAPWLLHRTEELWDRPNHFLPERFLNDARIDPYAFIPFSVGPRICAGLNFGLSESILCLAILAQRFRVHVRPGYRVEPVCRLTLRPSGGLPVTISSRRRAAA
jgi:cytochrome P450